MFRRLFWLVMGAAFGFGASFWLMRFVRDTVQRYSPERVSGNLADALSAFGQDVRAAVAEGRMAMRETEEGLRAAVDSRSRPLV
jgi:hypothetical protein